MYQGLILLRNIYQQQIPFGIYDYKRDQNKKAANNDSLFSFYTNDYFKIVCFLSGPTETILIGTSTAFSMNSIYSFNSIGSSS